MVSPTNKGSALDQWGLVIDKNLMQCEARLLKAPNISFKSSAIVKNGQWDLKNNKFFQPCKPLEDWFIFVCDNQADCSQDKIKASVTALIKELRNSGIVVKNDTPKITYVPFTVAPRQFGSYLSSTARSLNPLRKPQLLVVFLRPKPMDHYAAFKAYGDLEEGIATQCLVVSKALKLSRGQLDFRYYLNVALKINVKLGGVNSTVNLGLAAPPGTMILGADVTHPAPGSFAPSIAAVVGTIDSNFAIYISEIAIQLSKHETIAGTEEMFTSLLKQSYAANNKKYPSRLIMFRDGVSEGQFPIDLACEVAMMRRAFSKLGEACKPKITFIVCGKRHHVSIFPFSSQDGDSRTGNVKAGTTIDTDITSSFQFDWYCQSHASLLGTSRSAHSTVLVDENGISPNDLQQLVFNICHTYARTTRSVYYATPAYYADGLCTRAALYLHTDNDSSDAASVSRRSNLNDDRLRDEQLTAYRAKFKPVKETLRKTLFFMLSTPILPSSMNQYPSTLAIPLPSLLLSLYLCALSL